MASAKKTVRARRAIRTRPSAPARPRTGNRIDTLRAVEQFLYRQAELLDSRRWSDYIALFADDGIYWMPASAEQTTGDGVPSIFYEDRNLMTMRMKRLAHPHAWSQAPAWGTSHLVSNVTVENEDARSGDLIVRSRFHMMEFRRDVTRHFAGRYRHELRRSAEGFRISLQRVDMVNGEAPFDFVLQAWV